MVPKWLSNLLGNHMPVSSTDTVQDALNEHRREAEYANIQGDISLEEVRRIREESKEVHQEVKRTLKENHFADLMMRALESR